MVAPALFGASRLDLFGHFFKYFIASSELFDFKRLSIFKHKLHKLFVLIQFPISFFFGVIHPFFPLLHSLYFLPSHAITIFVTQAVIEFRLRLKLRLFFFSFIWSITFLIIAIHTQFSNSFFQRLQINIENKENFKVAIHRYVKDERKRGIFGLGTRKEVRLRSKKENIRSGLLRSSPIIMFFILLLQKFTSSWFPRPLCLLSPFHCNSFSIQQLYCYFLITFQLFQFQFNINFYPYLYFTNVNSRFYVINFDMDFQDYQSNIQLCIQQYSKAEGRSINLYKKAKKEIDLYEIHLIDSMAPKSRFDWLEAQKDKLNLAKQEKTLVTEHSEANQIMKIGDDIQNRLKDIMIDTEKAISASTYIRIELEKQIQALDNLEDQNKQFKKRVKRAKKGLKVIIRRAMMNKLTRILMILVLLAVIGLVVVSVLKDNGTIQIK